MPILILMRISLIAEKIVVETSRASAFEVIPLMSFYTTKFWEILLFKVLKVVSSIKFKHIFSRTFAVNGAGFQRGSSQIKALGLQSFVELS